MVAGLTASEVRFLLRTRPDLNAHEVVPVVDGELLTSLVDEFEIAAGMQPAGGAYGGLMTRAMPSDSWRASGRAFDGSG